MSTLVHLPREEFFSDNYMDAFYKAHVASRTRGGNLDEDIAAIEAEIRKVERYQSELRRYRFDHHLNSCGNSECSDSDDLESTMESSPTSVFKVYNSSTTSKPGLPPDTPGSDSSPFFLQRGPDVFTWAMSQQITHDHTYCHPDSLSQQQTHIDHGTIAVNNIQWHLLSTPKRAQAVYKLSCILQQRPSGRHSPTFSSLDLLPTSLANCIRKTGNIGISGSSKKTNSSKSATSAVAGAMAAPSVPANSPSSSSVKSNQNIDIKEVKAKQRAADIKIPVAGTTPPLASKTGGVATVATGGPMTRSLRKRTRSTPYSKTAKNLKQTTLMEVTRVRNISSCSEEGEDPVVID